MRARRHARAVAGALLLALAMPSAILLGTAAAEPTDGPTDGPTDDPSASASPTDSPTATPSETPTSSPTPTGPLTLTNAQLRWGVNNESNNAAFAPGTYNFFSAGEIGNPGGGGQTLPRDGNGATWDNAGRPGRSAGWKAQDGAVRIEKRQSSGGYALATFTGTSTDATGTRLSTGDAGRHSDHQVVINGGTGTVDPTTGEATVSWKGTFTVLYYSGMTFFSVRDPRLTVSPEGTELTATVSGYASDMNNMSKWDKVPDQQVVLAEQDAAVPLPPTDGFTFTPDYREVEYTAPGVTQVRTGAHWGAFPKTFLDAMQKLGSGAYWYSSGGSADPHKVALPIGVSYSAGTPIAPPTDPDKDKGGNGGNGGTKPTKSPSAPIAPEPPTGSATPSTSSTPSSTAQPSGPALPSQSAVALAPPGSTPAALAPQSFDPRLPGVPVVTALTSTVASEATSSGHPWEWWTGSVLLLGAAAITTVSTISSRVKGKS